MNVEPSRDPERMAHVWVLPKGLTREQALRYFLDHKKPRPYEFERFYYNPRNGQASTV